MVAGTAVVAVVAAVRCILVAPHAAAAGSEKEVQDPMQEARDRKAWAVHMLLMRMVQHAAVGSAAVVGHTCSAAQIAAAAADIVADTVAVAAAVGGGKPPAAAVAAFGKPSAAVLMLAWAWAWLWLLALKASHLLSALLTQPWCEAF